MKPRTEKAREPLPVRWVSGNDFARRCAVRLSDSIKGYIPRTALPITAYRFAAEHVFYILLSLPAAALAPLLAYLVHPAFLALSLLPLFLYALPWLRLKSMVGDHRRAVDAELPFFAVHAAVSQTAGLNIFDSLCSTIGKGVFRHIERAAGLARRYFRVLGLSPVAAVEKLGREHPHEGFRQLLLGYTSEFRSGGNVASYLEAKADEHLRLAKYRYERYAQQVGTVMELVLTTLLLIPAMLLMSMFLAPEATGALITFFLCLGIPLIVTFCFAMIRMSQPKDFSEYGGPWPLALVAGAAAFALLRSSLQAAVAGAIGVACLVYGIPVMLQRREASAHERSLPLFLRDVTELQKIGYPVTKAVVRLKDNPAYAPAFRRLLTRVAKLLGTGRRLSEIRVHSRSWLTRMAFFHLGQVAETGGLSPKSTELLSEFIVRVKEARDEARRSTSLHRVIALSAPFILAGITGLMLGLLQGLGTVGGAGEGIGSLPLLAPTTAPLRAAADAMVLLTGIGVVFLASYATDFTPKNAVWVSLGSLLALAAIALIPTFAGSAAALT